MAGYTIKGGAFIFLMLAASAISRGQDGSDILYTEVDRLSEPHIGVFVHLDFHNRSFAQSSIDTVSIAVDGMAIKFIEHRRDDGLNNWFRRQYLESLEKIDGVEIRVVKSRLEAITSDSVFVTNFLEYYANDKLIPERSMEKLQRTQ